MKYRTTKVHSDDPTVVLKLLTIHDACFGFSAAKPKVWEEGTWWLAYEVDTIHSHIPVAFAGVTSKGYLSRSGVLPKARGNGLQLRLIRARANWARSIGLERVYSDTTDNPHSAANLAKAGFTQFKPEKPWAFKHSLYWEKHFDATPSH